MEEVASTYCLKQSCKCKEANHEGDLDVVCVCTTGDLYISVGRSGWKTMGRKNRIGRSGDDGDADCGSCIRRSVEIGHAISFGNLRDDGRRCESSIA